MASDNNRISPRKTQVCFRLSTTLYAKANAVAIRRGERMSDVLRGWIELGEKTERERDNG